jgi:hypothetical protein
LKYSLFNMRKNTENDRRVLEHLQFQVAGTRRSRWAYPCEY